MKAKWPEGLPYRVGDTVVMRAADFDRWMLDLLPDDVLQSRYPVAAALRASSERALTDRNAPDRSRRLRPLPIADD